MHIASSVAVASLVALVAGGALAAAILPARRAARLGAPRALEDG